MFELHMSRVELSFDIHRYLSPRQDVLILEIPHIKQNLQVTFIPSYKVNVKQLVIILFRK